MVVALAACALAAVEGSAAAASRWVGTAYLAAVALPLCEADLRERRLPNALVLPGYAFAAVGAVSGALARGGVGSLVGSLTMTAVVLAVLLCAAAGGALGMGDVKLAGLVALVLAELAADTDVDAVVAIPGWLAVAFGAAGIAAAGRILRGAPTAEGVPLGPYLLCAFWAVGAML
ncbi:prepilin peptidase [Leifsonia sp. Root227]|uniref:prepilin peptidase n=1 Tax=Leifsonia sp. Root227 TaxID=1736496 RepID=UPI000A44FA34|nr:prepilin peptidase [Leifsonia sp. Root227]